MLHTIFLTGILLIQKGCHFILNTHRRLHGAYIPGVQALLVLAELKLRPTIMVLAAATERADVCSVLKKCAWFKTFQNSI